MRLGALIAFALTLDVCHRSPPPILFGSDAGAPGTVNTPDAASGLAPSAHIDASRPPRPSTSLVAPGDGTSITVDGVALHADAGEHFTAYLPLDSDGDGDRDVLAVRAHTDGSVARVGFYRRDAATFVGVPIEGSTTPSDAQCNAATIGSTTARSAVVTYTCPAPAAPGGPNEGRPALPVDEHVVLALVPAAAVKLRITDLAPAPNGTLVETDVATPDRDGDGRDDVVVTVSARRVGEREDQAARASVVLLERATGYARDTSEPEASFARLAVQTRALATRRRAPEAVAAVDRVVRLRRALCSDAGTARVRIGDEVGVACGGSAGLRGVAESLARAFLILGEIPAALAITRSDAPSELGVVPSDRLAADVHRVAPAERDVTVVGGPIVAAGIDGVAFPRASALTLVPATSPTAVVLRGPATARIDLATMQSAPGEPGTSTDLQVRSLDGARALIGFYDTCEGVVAALCATSNPDCATSPPRAGDFPAGASIVRISDLPSAEQAARCLREPDAPVTPVRPGLVRAIGFGREGLVIEYRGRLFRLASGASVATALGAGDPLGGPFPPGSSASESGEYAALATPDGIAVRDGAGHWHLWSPAPLSGRFRQFTDLTVSNDGRIVAGMIGGQVWLASRGPLPTAPAAPAPAAP